MINKIKKQPFFLIEDSLFLLSKAKKSTLFRSAWIYTLSNILNATVPFVLLPILTRYLTPEDYGLVSMFTMLTSIVSIFVGLSVHGAIARQFYEKKSVNFPEYVGNCFYLLIVTSIGSGLILLLCHELISKYTSVPSKWFVGVLLCSIAQFINSVILVIWQVNLKPLKYGLFQFSHTLLNFILSILFIIYFKMNWIGRINAQIISATLFSILALFFLLKNNLINLKFNISYIKNAVQFGLPLIPHALGGLAMVIIGRLMVTNMVGLADTGIYSVGTQVSSVIVLLASSFNSAYTPWLYSALKKEDMLIKKKIVNLTYIYIIVILILAVSLSFFAPWFIGLFLGEKFQNVTIFVTWTALGAAFNGMYYMVTNYIFYVQKTYLLAIVTFVTALINLVSTYLLIKVNGSIGAAQSSTITLFVLFVLTWSLSAKVYKMPWFSCLK